MLSAHTPEPDRAGAVGRRSARQPAVFLVEMLRVIAPMLANYFRAPHGPPFGSLPSNHMGNRVANLTVVERAQQFDRLGQGVALCVKIGCRDL